MTSKWSREIKYTVCDVLVSVALSKGKSHIRLNDAAVSEPVVERAYGGVAVSFRHFQYCDTYW